MMMKTVSGTVRLVAKDHTYGINNETSISSPFLGRRTRLDIGETQDKGPP